MYTRVAVTVAHDRLGAPEGLESLVASVAKGEGFELEDVSIILADHDTVTGLNRTHLDRDYDTDVLAFDLSDPLPAGPVRLEGEVYVDLDTAAERAPEFSASYDDEVRRYVIHGVLHLAGYRDDEPGGKARMREKENLYLGLQVPNL